MLTEDHARKQIVTGLEYWFTLSEAPGSPPPPRAKMATLTLVAIYPLSLGPTAALGSILDPLPVLVRSLLVSALLVLLMTCVVMPRTIRLIDGSDRSASVDFIMRPYDALSEGDLG